MLLKPDCIPCITKMTLDLLRKLPIPDEKVQELYQQVLLFPELQGKNWQITSPQVIEPIMNLMSDTVLDPDPFAAIKAEQNRRMEAVIPAMRQWVQGAESPLETAVKLAIIGNAVDFMISGGPGDLISFIQGKLSASIPAEAFSHFTRLLEKGRTLVYFADNCGEILADKLLIETLKSHFPELEVFLIVRSMPTLNDVTVKEALSVGMDAVATIVQNGMDGPVPGTILSRCSKELRHLVYRADLVVSKGGGNFDTLSEEAGRLGKDFFFLLLSKCDPLSRFFNANSQDLILFHLAPR